MTILCWSLKHESLSVAERGRLVVSQDVVADCLNTICCGWIQEIVLVSTCQRFEIYTVTEQPELTLQHLDDWVSERLGHSELTSLTEIRHVLTADIAARHLFEVACGLDSLTLGETEILGQLRRAWESAKSQGLSGTQLNHLFTRALAAGRQVRHRTGLGSGAQSLESLAIEKLAAESGLSVAELRWLVIGAGQLGQAVMRQLRHRRALNVRLINRSQRSGLQYQLEDWSQLTQALSWADAVLVCTAAPLPILTVVNWPARKTACALADLALPQNIEPELGSLPEITLTNLEDFHRLLETQQIFQERSLGFAHAQLEACWQRYLSSCRERELSPLLTEIFARVKRDASSNLPLRQQLHPLIQSLKLASDEKTRSQCNHQLQELLANFSRADLLSV